MLQSIGCNLDTADDKKQGTSAVSRQQRSSGVMHMLRQGITRCKVQGVLG